MALTEWFAARMEATGHNLISHDKFGATYKVKAAGQDGTQLAWLCNVMHTVFGGEHPTDIYIHSITTKKQ